MPMDLMFSPVNKLSAPVFRAAIAGRRSAGGWPIYVISNHDIVRSYNRYGDGKHNDQIAKLMAGAVSDPARHAHHVLRRRDRHGEQRSQAQGRCEGPDRQTGLAHRKGPRWRAHSHAMERHAQRRIHPGTPWLPVPPSYKTHNVASELKDPDSILKCYKHLLAIAAQDQALLDGDYVALNQDNPTFCRTSAVIRMKRCWWF